MEEKKLTTTETETVESVEMEEPVVIDLYDDWSASGTDSDRFQKVLQKLADMTSFQVIEKGELHLMTPRGYAAATMVTPEGKPTTIMHPERLGIQPKSGDPVPAVMCMCLKVHCIAAGKKVNSWTKLFPKVSWPYDDKKFYDEIMAQNTMLFLDIDEPLAISNNVMSMLGNRIGINGDTFVSQPSWRRNAYVEEILDKNSGELTLVIRNDSKAQKVFAVHSGTYVAAKQTFLIPIIKHLKKEMGETVCRRWSIDHDLTSIVLLFPQKAKELADMYGVDEDMIPGVWLGTSDTGESSITAYGCWKMPNGQLLYTDRYTRVHKGNISTTNVVEEIKATVFDQYTVLPKALCDGMTIDVPFEKIPDVMKFLMEGKVGTFQSIREVIGVKASRIILQELPLWFTPGMSYTMYDMLSEAMNLADQFDNGTLNAQKLRDIQGACGRVPYLNFRKAMEK